MTLESGKKKRLNTPSEFIFNEDGSRDEFIQFFESEHLWKGNILQSIPNKKYVLIIYHRINAHSVKIQYENTIGWIHISSFNAKEDNSKVHQDWLARR